MHSNSIKIDLFSVFSGIDLTKVGKGSAMLPAVEAWIWCGCAAHIAFQKGHGIFRLLANRGSCYPTLAAKKKRGKDGAPIGFDG